MIHIAQQELSFHLLVQRPCQKVSFLSMLSTKFSHFICSLLIPAMDLSFLKAVHYKKGIPDLSILEIKYAGHILVAL